MNATHQLKKIVVASKAHPKKTTLLIFLFSIYLMYRKRKWILQFTFNQVITRMNQKFMKQMSDQVSNVEKYNNKLSLLQQFSEEFYAEKKFKIFQQNQCFKSQEIDNLKAQLKRLDKSDPCYQQERTQLFIKLTQELLIFGVSVLHFSRLYELLIYMSHLLFIREKSVLFNLMDQDNIIVQKILIQAQAEFCVQLQNQIREKIMKTTLPNYSNIVKFQDFQNFIDSFTLEYELADGHTLIQLINVKKIQESTNIIIKDAFDKLQIQPDLPDKEFLKQGLAQAQEKCKELVAEMLTLNQSPSILTFYMFSMKFSFTKIWNRFEVLDGRQGNKQEQAFFTHLTNLHKICSEEYLNDGAEQNNEQFYHKKIKQAFNFVNNITNDIQLSQQQFVIVNAAINESIQNKIINQTIRQISRKVFFQDEFQVKEESNDENQQGGFGSEFANMLLQFTTKGPK